MRRPCLPVLLSIAWVALAQPERAAAEPAPPAPASSSPERAPRPSAAALVWTTSPVALRTGLVLGGAAEVRKPLGPHGLFAGARLALGQTTEANREWRLTHLHGLVLATVGAEKRIGAGLVDLRLGLGSLAIRQLGERQQYERLAAAGVPDIQRDAWSFGPWASAELGLAVAFSEAWRVALHGGPAFTVQKVAGTKVDRWVLSSGLGVAREF